MDRRRKFEPAIHQKKSLGQVFLRTDWPALRVVDKLKQWGVRRAVEIGPGNGILTDALLDAGIDVTAVEKDERFYERLVDKYRSPRENTGLARLYNLDILQFDLPAWIAESKAPAAVVGNIPYNISTPILMWVLPHLDHLEGIDFLTQLEFAARLAGHASSKAYGSLSVYAQLRSRVELDCKVERSCFQPVPKVDSALVTLVPMTDRLSDAQLHKVEVVTRAAFTQRRKKLRNAVKAFLKDGKEEGCPIDLNRRPDALSPQEFVELARFLFPQAF